MLAEHLLSILTTAFPNDDVVELIGKPPSIKDQKVTIVLICDEGVDDTIRTKNDPRLLQTDVGVTIVGRDYNEEEYSVRNRTRELLELFDIKNMSKEQLQFTDGTNNYYIMQMNPTSQAYGLLEERTYSSTMTFNNIFQQL